MTYFIHVNLGHDIYFLRYSLEIGDGGWGLKRNKNISICQLQVYQNKHFEMRSGSI